MRAPLVASELMDLPPGQVLRLSRERAGLSQDQLAKRAGTAQSAISRIEKGRVSPTVVTLARLIAECGEELVLTTRRRER